jgi:hypothetical protein
MLELQAARSLALWRDQDQLTEARDLGAAFEIWRSEARACDAVENAVGAAESA